MLNLFWIFRSSQDIIHIWFRWSLTKYDDDDDDVDVNNNNNDDDNYNDNYDDEGNVYYLWHTQQQRLIY